MVLRLPTELERMIIDDIDMLALLNWRGVCARYVRQVDDVLRAEMEKIVDDGVDADTMEHMLSVNELGKALRSIKGSPDNTKRVSRRSRLCIGIMDTRYDDDAGTTLTSVSDTVPPLHLTATMHAAEPMSRSDISVLWGKSGLRIETRVNAY